MVSRIVVSLVGFAAFMGCGQTLYQHRVPQQRTAEMVYVGSQVAQLETEKLPKGRVIYTELMLENGERVYGRLLRINMRTIEVSTGFFVGSGRPPARRDNQLSFGKDKVLALRLWSEK